ncbi:hypothetical protein [Achromobacter sp. UMC46]|uniref:hypothetical protein n=1 Tax=Achromobacter sp. UMC46 TaxID=1862319 RepID=UPI0016027EEC|nr:hypothetical protein [Achromobacter sp. UMC46]
MTSQPSRPTHAPAASATPDAPVSPHAEKDRAKADHLQEEARRKALANAQHKESPRNMSAPRYHGGHRGG